VSVASVPASPVPAPPARRRAAAAPTGRRLAGLSLAALGVVYGDIGTSPLYAFRESFKPEYGLPHTPAAVQGVLSMIVWSLVLMVSVKYIALILRADNHGEGGILALLALVMQRRRHAVGARLTPLAALGLFGAALLYGDGIITPAISVLSATEGLEVTAPHFRPWVVPTTVIILVALFLLQRRGTGSVGRLFGPIMLVWFLAIGVVGAAEIVGTPAILAALAPWHAALFIARHPAAAFVALGAVVLTVTGAEALYADMGHFGRRPIRVAWFGVVLPALLLNYLGQGALVLREPEAAGNPFYLLVPRPLLYPFIALATVATVIASQALISGAFSLARQTIQLGHFPRLTVVHTSWLEEGQIYVPEVNAALTVGTVLLVLGFRSSSGLAAAYGIAVTGTMAITTALLYVVARERWRWSASRAVAVAGAFIAIDLAFLAANALKITHGGWVPLDVAAAVFLLMSTWRRGTYLLRSALFQTSVPLARFFGELAGKPPARVPGTAVFLTAHVKGTPEVLLHHLRHNKVLHEEVVFLSIITEDVPEVDAAERTAVESLGQGIYRVTARYGFMETPNVSAIIARCCGEHHLRAPAEDTSYYLGRPRLLPTGPAPMTRWRKSLFVFMARNARSAADFFAIPRDRVVELGMQIEF
jgi:KUP system potassium uptake protein